jgi:alanine dehydrogenase
MVLLLNREDVVSVLQMSDCIDAMEQAFRELANGTAILPLRINLTPPGGLALYMPAYLGEMNALACKVVSVYKDNPTKYNLPTVTGKVLLQDAKTGDVISVMDGGYLTAMRTGAVSGLAAKYLAREDENQVAGILGAGIQGEAQLWAVYEVRKLSKALIFDVDQQKANAFSKKMSDQLGIQVDVVTNIDDVLSADIICTATTSPTPLFDGSKVREGTHINGIGSHSPKARELDTTTIQRSVLIADSREGCLSEAGDIMIPIEEGAITPDHIYAELSDIVVGKKKGRIDPKQITLFKSNGLAIQDTATAKLVYDKAKEKGIGKEVEI